MAGFDVRGIVWSDAGAADPVAAAEWVWRHHEQRGLVTGIVSLGDPTADGFGDLVDRLRRIPRCAQRQGAARGGPGAGRSTRVDAARAARRDRAPHPDGPPGATATIELAADETVICTFTNAKDALDNPPVDNPPADNPINTPPVSLPRSRTPPRRQRAQRLRLRRRRSRARELPGGRRASALSASTSEFTRRTAT
jgi:hypothetical protein